jgi:hypothetical protein
MTLDGLSFGNSQNKDMVNSVYKPVGEVDTKGVAPRYSTFNGMPEPKNQREPL